MADPQRGSAEDRRLRAAFRDSERRREQQDKARWNALRDRELNNPAAEALGASIAAMQERAAEILQELDDTRADEPPAAPPSAGQRQIAPQAIFPSAEEAAATAGPWSPEFQAWRRQHIPSSRGLF